MPRNGSIPIAEIIDSGRAIRLTIDSRQTDYLAIWLRDHCRHSCCLSWNNGQRLLDVADIAEGIHITHAAIVNLQVEVYFSDGHNSHYPLQWLLSFYTDDLVRNVRGHMSKTLWDSGLNLPYIDYKDYLVEAKKKALELVSDFGFVILRNVPCNPGMVLKVAESFGYVRRTNYGDLFEVKAVIDPNNLAYSNLGLGCHTDNPYRDPVPTLQLLHCLENSADGGDSILLDGFKASLILQQESDAHFQRLTRQWMEYRFQDQTTDIYSRAPMIEVDDRGDIVKVRYNNRSIATIDPQQNDLQALYDAYRHFSQILRRKALAVRFKMSPGDLVLFDNTRVMHARSAFRAGGNRHLQGAYADLDSLYSTLAVLQRAA